MPKRKGRDVSNEEKLNTYNQQAKPLPGTHEGRLKLSLAQQGTGATAPAETVSICSNICNSMFGFG